MPPPDPNRRRAERPPEAGPDALDTPEYLAPTPPPSETEHKTFELQTVRVLDEDLEQEAEQEVDPGLRQADIPTAPSARVQRSRTWTMAVVLVALGLVAGIGLFAFAHLTRVEPLEPGVPSAQAPANAASAAAETTEEEGPALEASALPVVPASPGSAEETTTSKPAPPAPKATSKKVPAAGKPASDLPEAPPDTTATSTTSSVPLGPPEF